MKLSQILETYDHNNPEYTEWRRKCREVCPDCQFSGDVLKDQAVWWNNHNNPVIGDWDHKKGGEVHTEYAAKKDAKKEVKKD